MKAGLSHNILLEDGLPGNIEYGLPGNIEPGLPWNMEPRACECKEHV